MTKGSLLLVLALEMVFLSAQSALAQCSICTKTAMQLGDKAATGLNSGIVYLMIAPFAVVGYISYRWYKSEKEYEAQGDLPATPQQ